MYVCENGPGRKWFSLDIHVDWTESETGKKIIMK